MSRQWKGSTRRQELPKDWDKIVKMIKERDGNRCRKMTHGFRCLNRGTEVDHIADPADHRPGNLQLLCKGHHRIKTHLERIKPKPKRAEERHPGDLRRKP